MPTYQVTDPTSGMKLRLTGDSPPSESELEIIFTQQIQQRSPEQTEQQRIQRLDATPEIGESSGLLSDQPASVKATIASLLPVTTDPEEMGKIISAQTGGQVGVSMSPEGRYIARNNKTGAVAELNKPGASWMDAAQVLGIGSAFFPSGAGLAGVGAKTLGTLAARSAATQAGMEVAQTAGGGDLPSIGNIAMEAAVAPAAQVVGEKVLRPVLGAAARKVSEAFGRRADDATRTAEDLRQGFRSSDEISKETVEPILSGRQATIAESVDADPRRLQAIGELGISAEPIASQVSRNPQFRDIEQALATVPGSRLDAQSREFIKEVSQRADDLISDSGGSIDKAGFSENFRQRMTDTIEALRGQADEAYNKLDELIDPTTPAQAESTLSFIGAAARKLGGEDKMSPRMRRLLRDLSPKTGRPTKEFSVITGARLRPGETTLPTYELLSQRRKEVGQALKNPQFTNEEQGLLKALYSRLTQDQDRVAEALGGNAANVSRAGKDLVIQRKQLEQNAVNLLGKDLSKSITEVVGGSLKGLPNKGIAQFNKRISAIPEGNRAEVVATALNDIFRGTGAGKQAFDATQFSKFMDDLNRSPQAKRALYSNLPPKSRRDLTSLHRIAKGISEAQQQKTPTGRILSLFDQKTGLIKKLIGNVAGGTVFVAGGGGITGGAASNAVTSLLTKTEGKAIAASDLLASQDFQRMIRVAVREGSVEGGQISRQLEASEKALLKSEAFKRWANNIENSQLSKSLINGERSIAAYLLSEDE